MIEAEWWDYEERDEFVDALAGDIGFIIESALDARGSAVVALSGGKTPVAAYEKLAKQKLDWKHVTIFPADDRLVKIDSPMSNVAMLAKIFLPKGARVMPLGTDNPDYKAAGAAADARLQDVSWPPDLILLGMGEDGHTASILPGPDLQGALDAPKARRAIGVMPDPLPKDAPVARVTLTAAAIRQSRSLLIAITGEKKKEVLEAAIEEGASSKYPIGRVLAESDLAVDIHWSAE
ncbi:6-phosphogluconolactonase [Sphingomonas vulcanisoli]|uniref:6-phosphogluconolactonase n=1 Tax=Sphingomonas vulcanisoli TaxID=1658060 RepID=A0ABX0TXT7_9SPHN|nr:6-phosphogluconolactonase [Sphingomonas vulcanisoli]NIJ09004.1 6-phosphogluconolactonase [Sphingomonas vulcanisoli]